MYVPRLLNDPATLSALQILRVWLISVERSCSLVKALFFLLDVEAPVVVPVMIPLDRAHVENGLIALFCPAHP